MTPSDLTTARRPAGRGRRMRWFSPALLLFVACGVGPAVAGTAMTDPQNQGELAINGNPGCENGAGNPARKSASRTIAEPPSQCAPWTAPATKLSGSFVEATATLLESGVADPRGCDYRETEVEESGWDRSVVRKARGFVLPQRPGDAVRFAIAWNCAVRQVLAVGPKADPDADVRELAGRCGSTSTTGTPRSRPAVTVSS